MATPLGTLRNTVRDILRETFALIASAPPLVSPQGTPGATAYSYKIVAKNATGTAIASPAGSTTTGNAALSGTNFNTLNWVTVPRATSYDIYRTVGGATTGKIGNTTALTFNDTGLAGDAATAPTTNTSGVTGVLWSDDELLQILIRGCRDLWRGFIDLHQEHFFTVDETNVSLAANATSLTGVPANCFRVLLIEPRDTTSASTTRAVVFVPKDYNSPEFIGARTRDAQDPATAGTIYYAMTAAGAPVAAATIYVAPPISSALNLRLVYIPTLSGTLTADSDNPIPGESDQALINWTVAYALGKDREDRAPDANFIALYDTEKKSILTASSPRQEQEPIVVKGVFDDLTGPGLSGDDWGD